MLWLGIGVFIIGIAFAVLVALLVKPLNKLKELLVSTKRTTDALPEKIDKVTGKAVDVLQKSNETLGNVNEQVGQLSPVFHIIGDAGTAARQLSVKLVDKTIELQEDTGEGREVIERRKLDGLYGAAALGYYLYQKRQAIKEAMPEQSSIQ